MRLGLRYNSDANEAQDVGPVEPMPRVAGGVLALQGEDPGDLGRSRGSPAQYEGIVLPKMGPARQTIVRWGMRYVGYPYVWGGEWGFGSPEPSGTRRTADRRVRLLGLLVVGPARERRRRLEGGAAPPVRGVVAAAALLRGHGAHRHT